ncbi:hypothetical protein SELMODRAFT_430105 [Selaginella moellendorffii]|uniref:Uncharacterized protein n=1 Tax=Selaginella moellendorffii TaxID=88036 RepID=D8T8C4_SELML|nr:hypothetical protein SELMODRAFT_430105 [Selaginella moellendorffii]
MERSVMVVLMVCAMALVFSFSSVEVTAHKLGHCGDSCKHHQDCFGRLACMHGHKCADDPDLKTTICKNSKLGVCGSSCKKHDDCKGKLACLHSKKCGDDVHMKTNICKHKHHHPGSPLPSPGPLPAQGPLYG